jgi:formyltetrahydrofolate deformylase
MKHTILIDCADAKGLVHKTTGVLYHNDLNVVSNHEFVQPETGRFFMRTEIEGEIDVERIRGGLIGILPENANVSISENRKKRVVILVTKEHHALGELLVKHLFGELNAEILAVIGNHDKLKAFVEQFDLPFFTISHEGKTRENHELEVIEKVATFKPDFVILAKYMRILSNDFVQHYPNRIVNIHHSFLPAFVGANPYRQAHERGVKIIGATAHFVNSDLDEGPIIVQQIMPTDHTQSPQEMAQMGRDVEKLTLARALKLVFDDKVFVSENKTIIFD